MRKLVFRVSHQVPTNRAVQPQKMARDQVTAKLICTFVFTYAKIRLSLDAAHIAVMVFVQCNLSYCTTRRGVHYNRGVSSLKPVSEQLAKTLLTLEPHGIFR